MMQVALMGYGRFGRALGSLLEESGMGYRALDPLVEVPASHRARSLPELVAGAELVVVAVPVPHMRSVLQDLRPHLRPWQLVLDVGSVKVKPVEALAEALGTEVPWVGTHPLFGPLSLAMAERPLRVVICPNPLHPEAAGRARAFYERLGCEIVEQTPESHDQVMAHTHALTFFVAKGMIDAGTGLNVPFAPASFKSLARTIETVRSDAGHLFAAIQRENPFASEARSQLLTALEAIHEALERPPPEAGAPEAGRMAIPTSEVRSSELAEYQSHLDQLDRELMSLLARRIQLARRTDRAGAQAGQGGDAAREESLLAERRAWASELGLEEPEAEVFFRTLLRLSRRSGGTGLGKP
ncbi:prephenate dehydrogenase/arogenate dehydrogenase family protein [Hyalangium sp.]|uniref:prephenate dehydrogenase/arogenate dehydrogenase family protein n=1 Tax=Hyalangium sp. TaxID=2028555 RepID=UPI002D6EB0C6|nr:prephenate dehydrogenase/arogenate dehydrogenase family protein [Hyalangium sp.]HYH97366.1 prephenate dehydrogenase/arogenate dehydrogenase family protein [Hyalangium sp.]